MMKLYSYSSKSLNFVEARWFTVKFAIAGIIMGIIILFAAVKLNPSIGNALGFQSTSNLTAENNFLRQQVSSISTRVNKMEMQAAQLQERAGSFNFLLHGGRIAGDTVPRITNTAKGFKPRPLVYAAKSSRP